MALNLDLAEDREIVALKLDLVEDLEIVAVILDLAEARLRVALNH